MAVTDITTRILTALRRRLPHRNRPNAALACVLAAGFLLAPARLALAETPVTGEVNATVNNGYARLVFRLAEEVESEVRLSNGIVIINFKRPVDISVDRIASSINDYIGVARRDPDNMGVRLALSRKVKVNSMAAGERLFVDLLPEPWTGVLPGLPQEVVEELTRRARDAEKKARQQIHVVQQRKQAAIRVRVGKQPTFTRYVFDLPNNVGVSNDKTKGQLRLVFDAPLKFDLADAHAEPPRTVKSIEMEADTESVSVRFALAGKTDIRTFREDNSYIVDIAAASAKKPGDGLESDEDPDDDIDEVIPPEQTAPAATTDASPQTPAKPAPPDVSSPAAVVQTQPAAPPSVAAAAPVAAPAQPSPPAPVVQTPVVQASPEPAAVVQAPPEKPAQIAAPPNVEPPKAPAPKTSSAVIAGLVRQGDSLRLTFPFFAPTPAAVFRRADVLWLVFDSKAELDLAALSQETTQTIQSVTLKRTGDAAIVRIKLERPRLASIASEGLGWGVTIGDSIADPTRPLMLTRSVASPTRSSIIIPFEEPRQLHRIEDPEIGDTLLVVTALGPARGFLKTQDFVEFRALASTHGVAVQPLADDVNAEIGADKIVISRPAGLTLSAGAYGAQRANGLAPIVLDPQLWGFDRQADFGERQTLLLRTAAEAPENRRNAARLDVARFYLAREMGAEAKALLDLTLSSDRPAADDVPALVLRAVANIMLERNEEALRDLSNPVVGNQHDAPLWRALANARQGKYAEAREGFKNVAVAMGTLPIELQRLALKEAVRASIEVRDFAGAAGLLNEFETIGIPREMEPQIAVLLGKLAEGLGRAEDALKAYRTAAESWDRRAAAQGSLRQIALRYTIGDLKRPEVLSELESLTTAWRGDNTEIEALQLMARLYTEEGRYRDAFSIMRTALTAHPNSEMTRRIHDEAATSFDSLFLAGKSDGLPTIDALSLFYDFRELTPIGRRGDEMIRRLADRLVSVDLLYQATELLQYQVDHRLQGAARAQVATRLAVIYLMDRKPERALATLRATRTADLSNELRNQRLLIEARALSDMSRHDVALEVAANVPGREAVRLRSDILWAARRWGEAAEQLELLHGVRWQEWEPLSDAERADVLRAAIGFAVGEDLIGLGRLREKYAAKMADGPDRRAFEVVTAPSGRNGVEFRDVAKTIAAVDTLSSFLRDMRARYPETGASTTPRPAPPEKQSQQAPPAVQRAASQQAAAR